MVEKTKFDGIYFTYIGKRKIFLTKNLITGKSFFNERLFTENNVEYREWVLSRSKPIAAIFNGLTIVPVKQGSMVLYLGAAQGQTASHVSDIVGKNGFVFCVELSPRATRDLLSICEERENMTAILADANKPESYKDHITEVDVIYQDIAQKNQVGILLKNINLFLKPNGYALVAIKARSIDVTKNPKEVFKEVREELEAKLKILDSKFLEPFQKDHIFFVCQKK